MTDEELKTLVLRNSEAVARNSEAVTENCRAIREMREAFDKRFEAYQLESDKRFEARQLESDRKFEARQLESDRKFEAHQLESDRKFEAHQLESERLWQEILASRAETDRLITSFNRELGRLGNALGDYTESMFVPSLERVLADQFEMTEIVSPVRYRQDGETHEIDMVAHAWDAVDAVYLVEIKSRLHEGAIEQLHAHLRRFPRHFTEHRGKKLFGVLGAMQIPDHLRARVLEEGFYLATIRDDVFEIAPPDGFEPHTFGLRSLG
jgi:hypothetical protein